MQNATSIGKLNESEIVWPPAFRSQYIVFEAYETGTER